MSTTAASARSVVVVTRPLGDAISSLLANHVELRVLRAPPGEEPATEVLATAAADADALLVVPADAIGSTVMDRAPRLRLIAVAGAGIERIDLAAASRHGIEIRTAGAETTEAVADLAFGLLLAVARRIPELDGRLRAGGPVQFKHELGLEVHGKTLGLLGLGRSGQAMARRARGFGMDVLYAAPRRKPEAELQHDAVHVELPRLLAESDFLSIHASYSETTRGLLDLAAFRKMKPTAVIINTARGGIVVEKDLAHALATHVIAGAGLDVFEGEPRIDPELLRLPNVVVTPHIGTAIAAVRSRMVERAATEILAFFGVT